jgi:hypothetical protein
MSRFLAPQCRLLLLAATFATLAACGEPATPPPTQASASRDTPPPSTSSTPGNVDTQGSPDASDTPATPDIVDAPDAPGLPIGADAPDFELRDQHGNPRTSRELTSQGLLALVFYRSADW